MPAVPVPETVKEAEMDELFSFIGDKKRNRSHDTGGSPNSLCFRLVGGLDMNSRGHPAHGG